MTERWWYVRDGGREGPVPRERLADLVRAGWLGPEDLVWTEGMAEWAEVRSLDWLRGGAILRRVHDLVDAARHPSRHPLDPAAPRGRPTLAVDWDRVAPRKVVAAAGLFLGALGIAFAWIAPSRLAAWLVLGGSAIAAAGLHVEVAVFVAWLRRTLEARRAVAGPAESGADDAEGRSPPPAEGSDDRPAR